MSQLPTCFLIGDSISVHYGPFLEDFLEGLIEISRKAGDETALKDLNIPQGASGGDSQMVLNFLRVQLEDSSFQPDFYVFNFGLHDIKHSLPARNIQIGLDDYKDNLKTVISLLKGRRIKPVWIRSTPVVDLIHNTRQLSFKRYAKDLQLYNAAADTICKEEQTPTIDLYTFTKKLVPEHYIDHVHYDEPARALQAAFLAGAIQQHISVY